MFQNSLNYYFNNNKKFCSFSIIFIFFIIIILYYDNKIYKKSNIPKFNYFSKKKK